ncbi:MAG TPA: two-component regulator propeller domain-containing protein [Bryobacteraceae bacterium]|nr:two-component regulator propeller domain-containing protein [Bryobacteraceae bacterium]
MLVFSAIYAAGPAPSPQSHARSARKYSIDRWTIEDGLPNNALTAVMHGPDGYLWVAGLAGAARFDGVRFTPILDSLPNAHFRALLTDQSGSTWIGMVGAGLARIKNGHVEVLRPAQLAGSEVRSLAESSDGRIWVGTESGISIVGPGGPIAILRKEQGLPGNSIRSIARGSGAGVWIAADEGICEARNQQLRCSPSPRALKQVTSIIEDREGRIWLGGADGLYSMKTDFTPAFECAAGCFTGRSVTSLFLSPRNGFWAGFDDGGVARNSGGEHKSFDEYGPQDGLVAESVVAIDEDAEGSVWLAALNGGLERLRPGRVTMYTTADGLPAKVVGSIVQDAGGVIWAGSQCGPVSELRDGRFVPRFAEYTKESCALAMWAARDGSLWIGTDHNGLFRWHAGRMEQFGAGSGLSDLNVRSLFEDRDGVIWIGTLQGGLHKYSEGRLSRAYGRADGVAAGELESFAQDRQGRLWIGSNGNGLSVYENGGFRILGPAESPPENDISGLFVDSHDDLWVATDRSGLFRRHNNKWDRFGPEQGIGDRLVAGILEDRQGTLWVSTAKGISRVERSRIEEVAEGRRASLDPVILDRTDGMLNPEVSGGGFDPTGLEDRDGRLWFSTIDGIAVVDPARFQTNKINPPVVIEAVTTGGQTVPVSGGVFKISAGGPSLEISYTGLSLLAPRKVRFRYRVPELSQNWEEAGSRRAAFFPHLAPGNYTFEVLAANNDGYWSSSPAVLHIVVPPFWWERNSVRLAALLLLLAATGYLARIASLRRAAALAAELDRQQELERERSRIARDIHDDLGSRLTRMALMADSVGVSTGNELAMAAREAIQSMDELVWTVNSVNDTVEGFVSYAVSYAEEFLRAAHIRVRLSTALQSPDAELDADARRHLFLVFKEALNNVVKHSGASEVKLHFDATAAEMTVAIVDNGHGFDVDRVDSGGNGLRSMRDRVASAGGRCEIDSAPGTGTGVHIHVSLAASQV